MEFDLAFIVRRRSQSRAVIEPAATIPAAIPSLPLERSFECCGMRTPGDTAADFSSCLCDRSKRIQGREQEPAQPDTFALSSFADTIHAVIPVAGADQRQSVHAQFEAVVKRASAMLEQCSDIVRNRRLEKAVVLTRRKSRPFQERQHLVEHCMVATALDVICGRVRQPRAVVRYPRAHALSGMSKPPMLDVAFDELPACRAQQIFSCHVGTRCQQRHPVLKLIAETKGAARLIKRRTSPHAACQASDTGATRSA